MINKRWKMSTTNKKARKWLTREGFLIYTVPHSRFSKDAFGIADMIAIKDGEIFLVQIRTNAWGNMEIFEDFFQKNRVNMLVILFKDREKEPYLRSWRRFSPDYHHGDDNKENGQIIQDGHDVGGKKEIK